MVFVSCGISYGGILAILSYGFVERADFAYSGPVLWKEFFRTVERATASALVYIFRKGAEFTRNIQGRNASANEENVLKNEVCQYPPEKKGAINLFKSKPLSYGPDFCIHRVFYMISSELFYRARISSKPGDRVYQEFYMRGSDPRRLQRHRSPSQRY